MLVPGCAVVFDAFDPHSETCVPCQVVALVAPRHDFAGLVDGRAEFSQLGIDLDVREIHIPQCLIR